MFQIRQLLEVFGKNLLGYYSISDKNGVEVKKFTHVAWDFIHNENKKKTSRIKCPFDTQMILFISKWANDFVHTTYLYSSYIQFFVLKVIKVLFTPAREGVEIYSGKITRSFNYAEIKITNYNSLKMDFEKMLRDRTPDIVVDWKNIENVGAYIINES